MSVINNINNPLSPALAQANTLPLSRISLPLADTQEPPSRPSTIVSISALARTQVTIDAAAEPNQGETVPVSADEIDAAVSEEPALDAREQKIELAEQQQIKELSARDREVRNHEQAHASAGGQYAGSPTYEFQRGPDGVNYAVGGHVSIDASAIPGNPEATIIKAAQVKRAALAPAEPSPQDRKVAALATQTQLQAQTDLAELRQQEREERVSETSATDSIKSEKPSDTVIESTSVSEPSAGETGAANTVYETQVKNSAATNFITSNDMTSSIGSLINQFA